MIYIFLTATLRKKRRVSRGVSWRIIMKYSKAHATLGRQFQLPSASHAITAKAGRHFQALYTLSKRAVWINSIHYNVAGYLTFRNC